jgi:DNA-binding response OmpR family regulator
MKPKILIVDDEPSIVMTLEFSLKKKNFEVYIARDGNEAMFVMENVHPDAVLLDIMMPNIDGYETLSFIKNNPAYKNTKIIIISAKDKPSDIEKGLALGADRYIIKPFALKKVITDINELLNL